MFDCHYNGKAKDLIGRTIAQQARFKIFLHFLTVLCKTIHHDLRRLRTETATANYFNFHLELNASFIRYAEVEVWCRMRRQINAAIFKILIKGRNSFLNRSLPCISCFIFLQSFCTVEIGQCNLTVGCNRTPIIGQLQLKKHHTRSTQLNPPITELITITIATTTYLEK